MIAVITQAAPAAVKHRPVPSARRVLEVEVVEPQQRVEPLYIRLLALLPVEPPEIDPLVLEGVVQHLEVCLHKAAVARAELYRFAGRRVLP